MMNTNLMGIGFRAVRKPNLRGAHALYPIFQRLRRIAPFPGHKGREAAGYTTGFQPKAVGGDS